MDFGGFIMLGLAILAFVFYTPIVLFYSLRGSQHRRRHQIRLAALGLFVVVFGYHIRQVYFLDEPLPGAAGKGDVGEVRRLLATGASPNARGVDGNSTALVQAVVEEREEIVRVLLQAGANPSLRDDQGIAPLQYARKSRNARIVQMMERAVAGRK